jgi:hypothetical protein
MSNRLKGSDFGRLFAFLTALVAFSSLCYARAQDQDKNSAGAVISGKATAKDVGLPIYPGSKTSKR